MNKKTLMKIVLKYVKKGYNELQIVDVDDLYEATDDEKSECIYYYYEIKRIGTQGFERKIAETDLISPKSSIQEALDDVNNAASLFLEATNKEDMIKYQARLKQEVDYLSEIL